MVNLPEGKLWDNVNIFFRTYGQEALQFSRNYVLQEKVENKSLYDALQYFINSWYDVLHPALISLSCEAVGGNKTKTVDIGASIVLMAGAADIHDDIIDRSAHKNLEPTVFGKFGADIAILAGDTLLLKGIYLLHKACTTLPPSRQLEILDIVKSAFLEISSGVVEEASLKGKTNVLLNEFMPIVYKKVAAVEASMRIGGIIGGGSAQEIDMLSHFGRTYGVLLSLRDEFIDVFEVEEIKNRLANECLPLPILLALQDKDKGKSLHNILNNKITQENIDSILDFSIDCRANKELISEMKRMVETEIDNLLNIPNKEVLILLLKSTVEDL